VIRTVGVIVPAADEQDHIVGCLDAIRVAGNHLRAAAPRSIRVRVVVVPDSCRDATEDLARSYPDTEIVATSARCVGSARAAGARHLIATEPVSPAEMWLANTDADSTVPPHWLTAMVAEADRGADLVLGTVLPGPGLPDLVRLAWLARHHQCGNHPHVHGANLGIRADAYLNLGGWPQVSSDEDRILAQRASAAGHLRTVRTATIPVRTSTRLQARAPHGFSSYLHGLSA